MTTPPTKVPTPRKSTGLTVWRETHAAISRLQVVLTAELQRPITGAEAVDIAVARALRPAQKAAQ